MLTVYGGCLAVVGIDADVIVVLGCRHLALPRYSCNAILEEEEKRRKKRALRSHVYIRMTLTWFNHLFLLFCHNLTTR